MDGGAQPGREAAVLREMKLLSGSIDRLNESIGGLHKHLNSVSRVCPADDKTEEVSKEPECALAGEITKQRERIDVFVRAVQIMDSALEI